MILIKKEDGIEIVGESANFRVFSVLNSFLETLIKRVNTRKKIRPTEMLVLFCGYNNRALQCAYSGYEENSALRKSSIKAKRSLNIERAASDSVCSKA